MKVRIELEVEVEDAGEEAHLRQQLELGYPGELYDYEYTLIKTEK